MSWLWPLLLPPVLGRVAGVSASQESWKTRTELLLSGLCGLGFLLISALWLWRYHLHGGGLLAGQFSAICAWLTGEVPLPRPVWLLLGLFQIFGIQSGYLWGAALSQLLLGASFFLWGRALHSRLAGGMTVLMALAVGPLVVLARTLSTAPESVAVLVACSAAVAVASRQKTAFSCGIAGLLLGAAPLMAAEGWTWTFFGVLLLIPRNRSGLRIGLLLVPVLLSWGMAAMQNSVEVPGVFVWGQAGSFQKTWTVPGTQVVQWTAWWGPAGLSVVLAGIGLRRSGERLLTLLATLLPYLYWIHPDLSDLQLPLTLAGLPVLLGLGSAAFLEERGRHWAWSLGFLVLETVMVLGVVPGWLSPAAAWRSRLAGVDSPQAEISEHLSCDITLRAEDAAGLTFQPYGPGRSQRARPFLTEEAVFQKALSRFDQNNDGTLSAAEYQNYGEVTDFSITDQNEDQLVSLAEFTTWVKLTQPRPQDRPFVSAKNYFLSTPESRASFMMQRMPSPPKPPPPTPPMVPPKPLPVIEVVAGVGISLVVLGLGFWGWRRRRRYRGFE